MPPRERVNLVFIGTAGELDRVQLIVRDKEDCTHEVMTAITREKWVVSVGDRIEVQDDEP